MIREPLDVDLSRDGGVVGQARGCAASGREMRWTMVMARICWLGRGGVRLKSEMECYGS